MKAPLDLAENLASAVGFPVWGIIAAAVIFWVCAAAEADKHKRPEALAEMSATLRDPSFLRSDQAIAAIRSLFRLTFGARHLSWRCMRASLIATLLIDVVLFLILPGVTQHVRYATLIYFRAPRDIWNIIIDLGGQPLVGLLFISIVPDYISLWKTRSILNHWPSGQVFGVALVVIGDLVASIVISILAQAFLQIIYIELIWQQSGYTL